jgi:signal transduction histidine kinase
MSAEASSLQSTLRAEVARAPRLLPWLLLLSELALTAIEALVVLGPIAIYFPQARAHRWLLVPAGLALAGWSAALALGLRPLLEVRPHRFLAAHQLALRLPGRALWLRTAAWLAVAALAAAWLAHAGALRGRQLATLVSVCVAHSFAVSLVRWSLHKRILDWALARMKLERPWLETQAAGLFHRLIEVALVLGAATAAFLALFVALFVPITSEQFELLEAYFPLSAGGLGALWYFVATPRQVAPLLAYLRGGGSRELLVAACQRAHGLPFRMALLKLGFFVGTALLLAALAAALLSFTAAQALLLFATITIVSVGTSLYELIWSRAVLRPIVAQLMAQPGADQVPVEAPSLRRKLLLSFGGVLVFTVVLPLWWSFLQHDNLRRDFAAAQAERELATLLPAARGASERAAEAVRRSAPVRGSAYLHVAARGPADPRLPPAALATVRRRASGALELGELGLAAAYARVDPARPELGSVLVLVPVGASARGALNLPGTILFFAVILAISLGVVLLTSSDLTRPIRLLEGRAAEMAQGKLDQRVLPGGEFDEIGRLTSAFESMRRALQAKLRTIEKLNVGLEEKVLERTAALERANAELVSTIAALKQAQQRLVVSEKMASVGQLVAGIAHEINNPLNAVVNTVEPLAAVVADVARGPDAAGSREELEQMLRVIRSGAQRTQRIVQALRNYARKDGEALVRVELHAEIEETLALLAHRLRGIELRRELAASGELHAYRGELNQALMNLLANAAGALEGRADGWIAVRTRDEGDWVVIEVADSGPGIPDAILPRIWDPFFTTREVGKGTGLGLSITHGIVEHHGGRIGVRTNEAGAGGTTFRLELPRRGPPRTG